MTLRFVTVDVFTNKPFGGNPLAVVLDAEGLDTEQMQNVAMEFNLAETTFVLPPKNPSHTAEVRIFTPRTEVPFAGHPNVGTAFVLASCREAAADRPMVFEEKAGLVEVELIEEGANVVGARLAAPQSLSCGPEVSVDDVAAACSLAPGDIETKHHQPTIASCGLPFVIVELKTREALATASPRTDVFTERFSADRTTGIHLYVASSESSVDLQARMFAPLFGVPEDPATGSANVALIGLLAKLHPDRDVTLTKTIAQGVDMGRASLLNAEAKKRDGEVDRTRIGGNCVAMMEGTLDLH
jgi:trans-2,3-dihydro-3-hydroxyanthranilate isomerase